jgi:signal transduction histidine kinase
LPSVVLQGGSDEHRDLLPGGDPADAVDNPGRAERLRVAQELHGGILQEFTAAGFELKLLLDEAVPDARPAIERARSILHEQQRRLRDYVTELRAEPAGGQGIALAKAMEDAIAALRRQSTASLAWEARPDGARIPPHEMLQLRLLVAEAVNQTARLHGASEIGVSVELGPTLRITLKHDGNQQVDTTGRPLEARLRQLGGTCRRLASAVGGTLLLELPRM